MSHGGFNRIDRPILRRNRLEFRGLSGGCVHHADFLRGSSTTTYWEGLEKSHTFWHHKVCILVLPCGYGLS